VPKRFRAGLRRRLPQHRYAFPLHDLSAAFAEFYGSSNRAALVRARDYPAGRRAACIAKAWLNGFVPGSRHGSPSGTRPVMRYCWDTSRPCAPDTIVRRIARPALWTSSGTSSSNSLSLPRAQARRAYASAQFLAHHVAVVVRDRLAVLVVIAVSQRTHRSRRPAQGFPCR